MQASNIDGTSGTVSDSEKKTSTVDLGPDFDREASREAVDRLLKRTREKLFGSGAPPQSIGRHLVLERLGAGGMGMVYEAFDPTLDRRVAIKVLHHHLAGRHSERLVREARALAKLSHPNVVQIYEADHLADQSFVVMELVRGQTLRQWRTQTPPPDWRACVETYLQAGAGLAAAHERGLVHRDFKPSNAMVDEHGHVRVLDFGIARSLAEHATTEIGLSAPSGSDRSSDDSDANVPLTETGCVMGTLAYMPLEQMKGKPVSAHCDQFSFCVALYEAVYGKRPFKGKLAALLERALERGPDPDPPADSKAPTALYAILARGLAPRPEERWPSMPALLAQLDRLVHPPTRRWGSARVATLATGLLLGGGALAYWSGSSTPCTGASAALEGVWDDEQENAVKQAWSAAPSTTRTWMETHLDDYALAWTQAHRATCEATRVTREQSEEVMDLRMACLADRRRYFAATVATLSHAPSAPRPSETSRLMAVIERLPPISQCDEIDQLQQQNERTPPPDDPAVAAEVEILRGSLAAVKSALLIGRYEDALTQFEPVMERIHSLQYPPLVAEGMLMGGRVHASNGHLGRAEQDLVRAHTIALEHGALEVAAQAAQKLADFVGLEIGRHTQGIIWAHNAIPLATWIGQTRTQMDSMVTLGSLQSAQGHYEEAESSLRKAIELGQASVGPDDPSMGRAYERMGFNLSHQGKYAEAEHEHRRALEIWIRRYGEDHPDVSTGLTNIGAALMNQERNEEAEPMLRRASAILIRSLGPEHPELAPVLFNLATSIKTMKGRREEAASLFTRALELRKRALGPDDPDLGLYLYGLAGLRLEQGELASARQHFQSAHDLWERTLGSKSPQVTMAADALASILIEQGQCIEGRRQLEHVLEIQRQAFDAGHPNMGSSLYHLAHSFECEGDYAQAEQRYRDALDMWERTLGTEHPQTGLAWSKLATVSRAQGKIDEARAHAERAVAVLETAQGRAEARAEARFALARALETEPSLRRRAHRLALAARDDHSDPAEVTAWLRRHPR